MNYAENILQTIGDTPLVKLNKITSEIESLVLAKVESFNPGHSTKDRMALKMIEDAEKKGIFKVLDAETRLEAIEKETNEIIDKYKAVDRRTKDVRARKKVAAETFEAVVEKNFQANLEFAKKHSGLLFKERKITKH